MAFKKKIVLFSTSLFLFSLSLPAVASDFNLPFINASDLGTVYAGWAALAEDASTAYSNPAGLACIHCDQFVFAPLVLFGDAKFTGTTQTPPFFLPPFVPLTGKASTDIFAVFPSVYFAAPVNKRFTVAVSETVPFGLGTDFKQNSIVRYLATKSQIIVKDVGPSIGFSVTDNFSVGFGLDAQNLMFTLDNMFGPPISPLVDAEGKNHVSGWGLGWHGGVLYRFSCLRLGLSYNSETRFHSKGVSELFVPPYGVYLSDRLKSDGSLPGHAQLSAHYTFNRWAVMGTVFYTNWRVLDKIVLQNVVVQGGSTIEVVIPLRYRDTFDWSGGLTFRASERWLFRTGFQIMDTPTNDRYRGVGDPIGVATIVGIGAHFQQTACLGYDIGIAHSFFKEMPVNLHAELTSAVGHNNAQTSLVGVQITWNIR